MSRFELAVAAGFVAVALAAALVGFWSPAPASSSPAETAPAAVVGAAVGASAGIVVLERRRR